MRIAIDTDLKTLTVVDDGGERTIDLFSKEAFELVSRLWLKTSWNQKYSYTFTWLGRPIIQHPEDLVRLQEVIHTTAPDVIIETGIAHGGSLVFYASLFRAVGRRGRVIGVDVEIRSHNRAALEAHELAPLITLIDGDSVAADVVGKVGALIEPDDRVMVVLDSDHSKAHVLAELQAYHRFVTPGSYIAATDGIVRELYDVPRGRPEWRDDNPVAAVEEFLAAHPQFVLDPPAWRFNESDLRQPITAWPGAWLRRR
jgi:cephalosporin hydroxylase